MQGTSVIIHGRCLLLGMGFYLFTIEFRFWLEPKLSGFRLERCCTQSWVLLNLTQTWQMAIGWLIESALETYENWWQNNYAHLEILVDSHSSCISDTQDCSKPCCSRTKMNILTHVIQTMFCMCFKWITLGEYKNRQLAAKCPKHFTFNRMLKNCVLNFYY